MKVCVIYGSESGTSERGIRGIVKKWQEKNGSKFVVGGIMEGCAAAEVGLAALAETYDMLVVATSSNGEGDPPYNFHAFLKALYAAQDEGGEPLKGVGHAVLGFGCSHFDTFQNCPRLTDKLLGELGSTRVAPRAEVDEIDQEGGDAAKAKWSDAVYAVLTSSVPAKAACAWTTPGDTVLDKHDEMLMAAASGGSVVPVLAIGALLAAVAGVYVMKFATPATDEA
mmetsp:Transcript_22559/g.70719  ORF Transcript_22559/g.70719 Transcript_22559/m.70719 type:complete len:225 (+) Transcript_22559:215-889(+)